MTTATAARTCQGCGATLEGRRPNVRNCNDACKVRASRSRASGAVPATTRTPTRLPVNFAELAWETADGDPFLALWTAIRVSKLFDDPPPAAA